MLKKPFIIVLLLLGLFTFLGSEAGKTSGGFSDLCDLLDYTMVACSNAEDEFEGESGDIVKLDNGMIFELTDYNYNYAYRPEVGVFGRRFEAGGKEFISYKLVVEHEIYGATRIR